MRQRSGASDPQPAVPSSPKGQAATEKAAARSPGVTLNFADRPLRDVYRLLGQAHRVRFVVDAAVDQHAWVTINLTGLPLAEAIEVMQRTASHRISKVRETIYRVMATGGGSALADEPVQEENLSAPEEKP